MSKKSYYVYAHKNANGEVRFIGVGSGNRAFDLSRRSALWKYEFHGTKPAVQFLSPDLDDETRAKEVEQDMIRQFLSGGAKLCNETKRQTAKTGGTVVHLHITDADLHKALKVAAIGQGVPIGEVVLKAVKEYLQ